MGSCFSSASSDNSAGISTAKVIALDGSLKEYSAPVTVSSVLESAGAGQSCCFLCNSDSLYYNTCISALDLRSVLELGHLYFVLPVSKLDYQLSGSDMAALAVMASSALASAAAAAPPPQGKQEKRSKKVRIMPIELEISSDDYGVEEIIFNEFSVTNYGKQRDEYKREVVKNSRPRNRVRLSTIQEGDE